MLVDVVLGFLRDRDRTGDVDIASLLERKDHDKFQVGHLIGDHRQLSRDA